MDAHIIANRVEVSDLDYSQLTSLDWIVLDLSDGKRSFGDIARLIPVTESALEASYHHLRQLHALSWNGSSEHLSTQSRESRVLSLMPEDMVIPRHPPRSGMETFADQSSAGMTQLNWATNRLFDESGSGIRPQSSRPAHETRASASSESNRRLPRDIEDAVCSQYLPRHLFAEFRSFVPKLVDSSLEVSEEVQMFAEFIYEHLSTLTPAELLGLEEDEVTRVLVKQAYMMRTRQFHPDRYFRKNIGVFAPRIAAIFKAVTGAFTSLQAKAR
ncbi:MAG: hypothetical protein II180_04310 [Proteobacteria bacterium]|nr:hypothetical protein [Pseudomonadota bacterium]